jgi:hypothetical protein
MVSKGYRMTSILLKNVPEDLKKRIQRQAEENRRSLNQQILMMLEDASAPVPHIPPPKPIKPRKPFTHQWLMKAIRQGRA